MSERGLIYFSLGAYLKPSEMPKEKLDAIIETFKNLKQTVFWKFDGDVPAGLPDNVIIQDWFRQNDVLGTSKTVLFITQG